jgi:uncharacterized protein YqhQ
MPEGEYLQYGGQAIVEGVMMRSPRYFAVACRAPNQEIILRCEPVAKTWIGRQKWLKKPFLRGSLALFDAMALGYRALRFASDVQLAPQYQPKTEADVVAESEAGEKATAEAAAAAQATVSGRIQDISIGASLVVGMMIGLFIFVYLPNLLAQFLQAQGWNGTQINALAGVIKVVIFFAYLSAIGQLNGIREVFRYHGAEHKAINTLEADEALTMGNCLRQTRLHPRCGTSFAIIVLIISIVVFTFVPRYPLGPDNGIFLNVTIRVLLELLILPLISGVAYEVIRLAGKFKGSTLTKTLLWPGLMSQYITTREPAEKHIEVALVALQAVVDAEAAEKAEKALPPEPQVDEDAAEIA